MSYRDPREDEANAFAMELLMPEDFIRRDWEEYSKGVIDIVEDANIAKMARRYRVSLQMMMFRLVELGIIKVGK